MMYARESMRERMMYARERESQREREVAEIREKLILFASFLSRG